MLVPCNSEVELREGLDLGAARGAAAFWLYHAVKALEYTVDPVHNGTHAEARNELITVEQVYK
jgi:hypothetical protein